MNNDILKNNLEEIKKDLIEELKEKENDGIIEHSNVELLEKLINNAETIKEAEAIAGMGTIYKRTGLHFDHRSEKLGSDIKYLSKNKELSFVTDPNKKTHKLIIGDNYDALLNLLITHKNKIDVIYIDPPYGKDSMGAFADTNYDNAITRDNLLSMLEPRLRIAKNLLKEDGFIFVSIDDRNEAYIRCLMNEIFKEECFMFNVPRITKKGGKSTPTIQKNHDYVLGYSKNKDIIFAKLDKEGDEYTLEDEYVSTRGKYKLTQPLDYNSLQYSKNMDYEININERIFVPGGSKELQKERLNGNHGKTDWVWRWSKSAVEWGITQGLIVIKGDRVYTKTYLNCRKVNGKNELEYIDATKSYTTLTFLNNEYSNDNGTKELDKILENSNFKNPKPSLLISALIKMINVGEDAIILDFFAGSGTTGQAVLELNKEDGGNRTFILCTNNEDKDGKIADNVTSKRLKRIMTGECYDGSKDFDWLKENEPYGDNLDVYNIESIKNNETKNHTLFDVIDEANYDLPKFESVNDKIDWVCQNFDNTQNLLESDEDYLKRNFKKGE